MLLSATLNEVKDKEAELLELLNQGLQDKSEHAKIQMQDSATGVILTIKACSETIDEHWCLFGFIIVIGKQSLLLEIYKEIRFRIGRLYRIHFCLCDDGRRDVKSAD